MKIIVGLGNPTEVYRNTLHNMGFLAVDALAEATGKPIKKAECSSLTATFSVDGETVVLAKPLTYMNLSGDAVKSLLAKYKGTPDDLVVLYDDIDLDRFRVRARAFGGPGTHNGMKSIVASVGSDRFKRVRIGIGKNQFDLKDYVLSRPSKEDAERFAVVFREIAAVLKDYLKHNDFELVMRTLNGKEC